MWISQGWRESVNKGGAFAALSTDLSNAFDCLPHELFSHITKFHIRLPAQ